ncbi:MAG: nucleotidyl transferase AbiEii/AbiGii toxin family protein [Firmicutes bacterium]|nr:nucleotidyl transferase AbiEii/AbiGii toxin family protein [Bacillota bacterium]MCL2311730.1 nucleotidyl transferase AbiEii/AbiGii toxin family protein [Bacillota bacterium]
MSSILNFTKEQQTRIMLMQGIAKVITAQKRENFVLKGGTGLLLAYNLDRYSEDLDYDGKDRNIDLTGDIQKGAKNVDVEIKEIILAKNTGTVKRYKIHYADSEYDPLKLEISYRDNIDEKDVTVINEIRVYNISKLTELKTNAFINRLSARDIYDVGFLLQEYGAKIEKETLEKISNKISEVGITTLSAIMGQDKLISLYDTDEITLNLEERVNHLLKYIK